MKQHLIIDYSPDIVDNLSGFNLIIRISNPEDFPLAVSCATMRNEYTAIWIDCQYISISSLELKNNEINNAIIFYVFGLGDIGLFLKNQNLYKTHNVSIFISSKNPNYSSELKILSSLGIKCGVIIEPNADKDKFLDIASYSFLSQAPHELIEPFGFILSNIDSEYNASFNEVYFENPSKYLWIDNSYNVRFSRNGEIICALDDFIENEDSFLTSYKLSNYYSHFDKLDKCSYCPAFKICNHEIYEIFDGCEDVMKDVYEQAELSFQLSQRNKNICQR